MRFNPLEELLELQVVRTIVHEFGGIFLEDSMFTKRRILADIRADTMDLDQTNDHIADLIQSDRPAMVARFGRTEFTQLFHYWRRHRASRKERVLQYLRNRRTPIPMRASMEQIYQLSGVFPRDRKLLEQFQLRMMDDLQEVDLLASWVPWEGIFEEEFSGAKISRLAGIEPFFAERPWTKALVGKRVLVVHPFAETIRSQYESRRSKLFQDPDFLPEFELLTLTAVQSIAGNSVPFPTWFDALAHMEAQIAALDFDIAIIGCGAYGFPLAAHVKGLGKVALHLGGVTQMVFGISGARWVHDPEYNPLINAHWVKPSQAETPAGHERVEESCYW